MKKTKINYVVLLSAILILSAATTFGWKINSSNSISGDENIIKLSKEYTEHFTKDIGPRNLENLENAESAKNFIIDKFKSLGYETKIQDVKIEGKSFSNVIASKNTKKDKVLIGAHYNSPNGESANGGATPIASLLTLAELYNKDCPYDAQFVAFFNNEINYKTSNEEGTKVYVDSIKDNKEDFKKIVILDSIGVYSEKLLSQRYPFRGLDMPNRANFVAVNSKNNLDEEFLNNFKKDISLSVVSKENLLLGREESGVKSFWEDGMNAILVSDTGILRNIDTFGKYDTLDKINFEYMSEALKGIAKALMLY